MAVGVGRLSFHLWHPRTSRHVRYQPEWLPVAVEHWIVDRSLDVRRGNPYLTREEALVAAVHEFALNYPHVKGVLRRSDGTVIATSTPSGRPEVTFRAERASQA